LFSGRAVAPAAALTTKTVIYAKETGKPQKNNDLPVEHLLSSF
jgi:hypothetical protein